MAPSPCCGPQSIRYIHHVDPRRACGVASGSSPRPRSPHCCRCCDETLIAVVVVPAPLSPSFFFSVPLVLVLSLSLACTLSLSLSLSLSFSFACPLSLSRFSRSSRVHSLSPSLSFSHACPLSLSRFSRSLSQVFSPLVLALASLAPSRECSLLSFSLSLTRSYSLSPFSHASLPLTRVLSFSLSHSLSLPLVLVAAQGPPTSPAVPCLARRTQCHRSAPSPDRHSASHRVRRDPSRQSSATVPPLPPGGVGER